MLHGSPRPIEPVERSGERLGHGVPGCGTRIGDDRLDRLARGVDELANRPARRARADHVESGQAAEIEQRIVQCPVLIERFMVGGVANRRIVVARRVDSCAIAGDAARRDGPSQRGIELSQVFRRADVGPRTPESLARNPAVGYPPLEVWKQFERRPARKFVKQGGIVDADARVRVPRHAVERDPSVDEGEIPLAMVGRIRHQHEVGARVRCIARHRLGPAAKRSVVERRIDVAGHDQCGSRRQERQRRGDAAGHFERHGLERPVERHAVLGAIAQRVDELLRR